MSTASPETTNPPKNPIGSDGLTDLGPAQPKDPPHAPGQDAELRDPPSPAGVPPDGENADR